MTEKTKFWYLKNFNILDGMDEATIQEVSRMTSMFTVKTHQPIYFPDQPSHAIFFLKKGHVKISRISSEGKEIILVIVGPGEIFGELSLLGEERPPDELAEALDEALICAVRMEDFESLMKGYPALNLQITKRIGFRLRKFEERVTDLVFKDVRGRIAAFLVRYAEEFGKVKEGIISVKMHLSHQEIALLTGSARQTVTTMLNEFRTMGILDFSRQGIIIKQFDKLQILAK